MIMLEIGLGGLNLKYVMKLKDINFHTGF